MKENFLDKNTLIAVALVFMAWLSWDAYMRKKYPSRKGGKSPSVQAEQEVEEKLHLEREQERKKKEKHSGKKTFSSSLQPVELEEQTFVFQSENLSFELSSQGMGFKNLVLNRILDRADQPIKLFSEGSYLPFETRVSDQRNESLYFQIEQLSKTSWRGTADLGEVKVVKTLSVDPQDFLVNSKIKISGNLHLIPGISSFLIQTQQVREKTFLSFLTHPDFLSFFISSARGFEQIPLDSKEASQGEALSSQEPFSGLKAAALGTKYFGQAWMEEDSDVLPQFQLLFREGHYLGQVRHSILNPQKDFDISYKIFIGPKDFPLLKKKYPTLIHWVDFGWFGVLSRFILQILQFFYSLSGNWGLSIILLTLLVRMILLPLVFSSHRSMEVMKKVHPEIQKIKKKFKSEPQRINQEVMALMKSHRANPLGGCLPVLLQIPIFWSLWKALSNSYSLYRAPFVFWIQDLSWKDPYYILPVLMGLVMFAQQKISPVVMNKEMARAMQIMPVVMALFMINLPSGLVLYMLVSTAFGLVQQFYLVNKKGESLSFMVSREIQKQRKEKKNV